MDDHIRELIECWCLKSQANLGSRHSLRSKSLGVRHQDVRGEIGMFWVTDPQDYSERGGARETTR